MFPLGLPPVGGNGTTPEGLRRVIDARYAGPGVIKGCVVTGLATMAYNVSVGAVAIQYAANQMIEVPVTSVNVATIAAPSSGTRTDYIYVDASGNIAVAQSSGAVPTPSLVIAQFTVPAGISGTTGATRTYVAPIAVSLGGAQGLLARVATSIPQHTIIPTAEATFLERTFPAWATPRLMEVLLEQFFMRYSGGSDGEYHWRIYLNGALKNSILLSHTLTWERRHVHTFLTTTAGVTSTIKVTRAHHSGGQAYEFGTNPNTNVMIFERGTAGGVTI